MATARKKLAPIPVDISNVGGIHEAHLEIRPGCINVLVGRNGLGKSTSYDAIRRAAGERVALEVRDGAHVGSVELPGIRLQVKGSVRSTGHAEVRLADTSPLARLIDPGYKGSDEAATARVRALLEMVNPAFDAGVVRVLADQQSSITEAVEQEVREGGPKALVDVAERVRVVAHTQARAVEAEATQASARAANAELNATTALDRAGGEEALVAIGVPEAERVETLAREALGAARAARDRRLALERQQAEIRATLGVAPDPELFTTDIHLRERALEAADARARDLERQAAEARLALASVRADRDSLVQQQNRERELLAQHQRSAAVLALPVEGPTEAELELAEGVAIAAQEQRRSAVVSAEVRNLSAVALAAKEEQRQADEKAGRLRDVARTVFDRLALLPGIAERAFPLTILAGRVHVIEGDQVHDFETRRSEGQRIDAAFAVAARAYAPADGELAPIVALDARYWVALDPEHRIAAARAAEEHGLAVLTEQPTSGPLGIAHVTGDPASLPAEVAS